MLHLPLAIKHRPKQIKDIIGQEAVREYLEMSLSNNSIHSAILFSGTRGSGKTSSARIVAMSLSCLQKNGAEPCLKCDQCSAVLNGSNSDILELDAASHTGVDSVRSIIESANYVPVNGKYRVFLIDEVHMLSKAAFNALLKTLEEPPEHAKFILATTEPRKVPITILSRCHKFHFRSLSVKEIANHLSDIVQKEGIKISEKLIIRIAMSAMGSIRDALSLLDQISSCSSDKSVSDEDVRSQVSSGDIEMVFDIMSSILTKDILKCMNEVLNIRKKSLPDYVLSDLATLVHSIVKYKVLEQTGIDQKDFDFYILNEALDYIKTNNELIQKIDIDFLLNIQNLLTESSKSNLYSDKFDLLESFCIRAIYLSEIPNADDILSQIKSIQAD